MLKGHRTGLRLLQEDDFDKILSWENNPANWRVSTTTAPFSKETIAKFVKARQDIFRDGQLRLIICRLSDNEAIGTADLFEFDAHHQRAGVGILVEEKHRRQGYALEALELLKIYALNEVGIRNLFANILADNEASIFLFEKAGFFQAGHKKGWFNDNGKWIDELFFQARLVG